MPAPRPVIHRPSARSARLVSARPRAVGGPAGDPWPGRDAGQALPLLAGALVLVALLALGVVRLGGVAAERARASAAADAAALAAVIEGREGAERTADANGGRLTGYVASGGAVEVTVRVGDHEAVARARSQW